MISLLIDLLLYHKRLIDIILLILLILQLQRITPLQIIPLSLLFIRLFVREDDPFAVVEHIVLLVEVDLRDLGHPFVQREHQVVLGEASPLPLAVHAIILAARFQHQQVRLRVENAQRVVVWLGLLVAIIFVKVWVERIRVAFHFNEIISYL